jgi:uncharacterized phiE125 gp8 family phage protein
MTVVVTTPAASYDLTVLETVKTELEITDNAKDAYLATLISQASAIVAAHCKRVFARETVTETLRPYCLFGELILARYPVVSIDSIVENNVTLTTTDYEFDSARGTVTRLVNDRPAWWPASKIVISYSAGYTLLGDLPYGLERGTLNLIKALYWQRGRDPAVRSEDVVDISSASYRDLEGHLPPDVAGLLGPYRNHRFA